MDRANKWVSEHKAVAFILYNLICWAPFLLLALTPEFPQSYDNAGGATPKAL
jgi:hypothetical protein